MIVKKNGQNCLVCDYGVTLAPGANVVPDHLFAKLVRDKGFRARFDDGELELPDGSVPEAPAEAAMNDALAAAHEEPVAPHAHVGVSEEPSAEDAAALGKLNNPQALKLVRETFNEKLLRAWKSVETRPKVAIAIDEALEALSKVEEKPAADAKGDDAAGDE